MTEADDIGHDGTVRLGAYLPLADLLWFSAGCDGLAGCGHAAPISVRAAVRIMGSGEATVGDLAAAPAVQQPVRRPAGGHRAPARHAPACGAGGRGAAAGDAGRACRVGKWCGAGSLHLPLGLR